MSPDSVTMAKRKFNIGFTMQNVRDLTASRGSSLQVRHIINFLKGSGHEVTLLTLRPGRKVLCTKEIDVVRYGRLALSDTYYFKYLESAVRRVQTDWKLPYLGLFDNYRFYEACYLNLSGCDLLHERNALFAIGTAQASERLGLPFVLSLDADEFHEYDFGGKPLKGLQKLAARWMAQYTYRRADALICVSQAAKSHFSSRWGISADKIFVIPNGVDTCHFHPGLEGNWMRKKLGLKDDPVIVFVGDFWPWHGLDLLIQIMVRVLNKVPQTKLVLIGDGVMKPAIVNQVRELHLEKSVIFTGRIDYKILPQFMSVGDIAVLPYPRLSLELWFSPLKLYEYMAAGKAIIASRAGQIKEVLQDGFNGVLVEAGDIEGFAQGILRLINSDDERKQMGANARRQAEENHSWHQYTRRLEDLYVRVTRSEHTA